MTLFIVETLSIQFPFILQVKEVLERRALWQNIVETGCSEKDL